MNRASKAPKAAKKVGRVLKPASVEAARKKKGDELIKELFLSRRRLPIVNEPESDPAVDRRMAAFASKQSLQDLQDDFDLEQAFSA